MIDTLENQVWLVNQRQSNIEFVIARSFTEFKAIADAPGKIAIAHAIEGGHALGRKIPVSDKRTQLYRARPARQHKFAVPAGQPDAYPYIRNLEALHARGVCLMTIAHLFPNDLAYPCEGISADEKKNIGFAWNYDPVASNIGLTEVGKAVVRRMLEIGMVVDLTHSTPACRKDVFVIVDEVNADRQAKGLPPRPVAFTHVGLQAIFQKYDHRQELQNYRFYDIDRDEIKAICKCNGIIGVIPENFWLVGADKKIQGADIEPRDYRVGIGYIIETIRAINDLTDAKDFSNIGIGTDFDGLADAPNDLYVPRMLGGLINAIGAIPGITDAQVRAITSGNAYRMLEHGWG
jgi:microsomal dipeptidase-like Zn-dependent dipeptidase